jgi:hypothetical protein
MSPRPFRVRTRHISTQTWFPRSISIGKSSSLSPRSATPKQKSTLREPRQTGQGARQNGFKDEITLSSPGCTEVTAISLWDNKGNAEAYNSNGYPEVLKALARVIDGTPKVQTGEVVNSTFHKTFHKIAAGLSA